MINDRVRKLIDAVYDMVHGDTPVGPRLTKLKETYEEVRFYDIYPSVAYLICRGRTNPQNDTYDLFGVVLDDRDRAAEVMRTAKLRDAAESYNEYELHDEEYNEVFRWYLKMEIVK